MTSHPSLLEPVLGDAFARWKATAVAELKGAPFEKKLVWRTPEGIAIQPLYTRADLSDLPDLATRPGEPPYLRGFHPEVAGERSWEIAQEIAAYRPADFNAALLADLQHGQDSVVLTPDAAARAGLDPDQSPSEVFRGGLSLSDQRDFNESLLGVDLAAVPIHLRTGADARPLAALYLSSAGAAGFKISALTGSITADPLAATAEKGQITSSLEEEYDALASWTQWASLKTPRLRTIGVDVSLWAEAGATSSQELAFSLTTAAEYVRAFIARGIPIGVISPRILFKFGIGPHFFTEIAKLRAFRLVWTRVLSSFGAEPSSAAEAGVSAATGRWNKSLLDPYVNMLRVTTEALSAVLGGCDSLHVAPFDEETGATNDFSRRIARNVHTLLAEEFGFTLTADPAGGSWYVERLTAELARSAWTQFQALEKHGGMQACLRSGYAQDMVAKEAAVKAGAIARRRRALVGTNLFPNLNEIPLSPVSPRTADIGTRLCEVIARRPAVPLSKPAKSFELATIDAAIEAAAKGATLGQLTEFTRPTPRAYFAIPPLLRTRGSVAFEQLRRSSLDFAARTGSRPRVFLAKMGPSTQHKARADFSAGFFAVGGFEVLAEKSFEQAEDAAQEALASGAPIVVLCSTDESYLTLAEPFARAIKNDNATIVVVLAGLPTDPAFAANLAAAGFDEFIHVQTNVLEILSRFLTRIEASL